MSFAMNGEAILRAIKGVVAGELGTLRKVLGSNGERLCEYAPGLLDSEEEPIENQAFFQAGSWFDVRIKPLRPHPSSPGSARSSQAVRQLLVTVELLSSGGNQDDDYTITLQGRLLDTSFALEKALGWPDNLTLDDRGQQTGIVEGCLVSPGTPLGGPVSDYGKRDCHLQRWAVTGVAILDLAQEV
jgi:hypothetical protein